MSWHLCHGWIVYLRVPIVEQSRSDAPCCIGGLASHGALLADLVQQVDDPGEVHYDTEPEQRGLVGVQHDRCTGKADDRQDVSQVVGAAGQLAVRSYWC